MQRQKNAVLIMIALMLLSSTLHGCVTPSAESGGELTYLEQGQPAPYSGWLLDETMFNRVTE